MGFLGSSAVKNLSANAGDVVSVPGSGRFPAAGNGKPTPVFYKATKEQRACTRTFS